MDIMDDIVPPSMDEKVHMTNYGNSYALQCVQ
jgi:hypothetical protein